MPKIKISSIAMPEHYVRGKINAKNVSDLMDVVVKAHPQFFKDEKKAPDWHELIGKKLEWPFYDDIKVASNPKPKVGESLKGVKETGRGKKKGKVWKPFELIDGGHRLTVWRRLKQKEISSSTKNINDPVERYLEQYRTNSSHGLRLDKDQRDDAIRTLGNVYKMGLGTIAKETGLSRMSISRILRDRQRSKEPRKKGSQFESGKPTVQTDMSVGGFMERLDILSAAFSGIKPQLSKWLTDNITESGKPKLQKILSTITEVVTICSEHAKSKV